MANVIFYLVLAVAAFYLIAVVASIVLTFTPAALAAGGYAMWRRGWKPINAIRAARGGDGKAALSYVVLVVYTVVATFAVTALPAALKAVTAGTAPVVAALTLCLLVAAIGTSTYLFHLIVKGELMKDIFAVLDDQDKFDAFAVGNDAPLVIEIDPEVLRQKLRADVIGQDAIIEECVSSLARRVRIQRKAKPLGVYMYVGASGAGKTELAKSIAKHAFENRLVRFDMNQFTEAHSTQSLIGSPAGYIGSDKGGQLTQEIKRLRSGVILFDEIEKAHPDVFKLIMTLLDEGRITEQSSGKVMDASKFVIVMTSNAEHEKLAELAEKIEDLDERRRAIKDTLQVVFKPEQLARIDDVFCFKKLDKRSQAQVIGKFLFGFAADVGVDLAKVDTDLLIDLIRRHEKNADYGIRELIRLVEKMVLDGMYEAKDEGYNAVALRFDNETVTVVGVEASRSAA